ncbi:MAG: holo-ACP synthase [Synergistaceae bacterium]|jgi:holo-[acyl-carrier protein] synthase|nr:holo-ACP synthase [Synergistaceae bacterium]
MILGVGTDLCRISRMERAIANDHFVEKIFSPEEIEYARSKGSPAEHFAAAFAAKEAIAKASGLGLFGIGLSNSMVRRTDSGPLIVCCGSLLEKFDELGIKKYWLSLTHEGDYALAFVVLES